MLWLSYLNAVLKKSSVFFALLFSPTLFALESRYLPSQEPNTVRFHALLTAEEVAQLQESLKDGYRVEISFFLRMYEERKTVFFGDTLLFEAQHSYTAWWDPIGREYRIASSTGEQHHSASWGAFHRVFTHSPPFRIPPPRGNRVYTTCQAVLKLKLFNPPLHILNTVGQLETLVSNWVRVDSVP